MPSFRIAPELVNPLLQAINDRLSAERAARSDDRVHVTEAIYCLRKGWRKRKMAAAGISHPENPNPTLLLGHAWDSLWSRAAGFDYFPHYRVGNDRISGEADGVLRADLGDGPEMIVVENKTTAAGPQTPAPLRWAHWVEQAAAYQAVERLGRNALLAVLHLSMPKVLKAWLLRFTDDELDAWAVELDRRVDILTGPDEPSTSEAAPADSKTKLSWECGYCPFFAGNGGDCEGSTGRPRSFFSTQPEEWNFNVKPD